MRLSSLLEHSERARHYPLMTNLPQSTMQTQIALNGLAFEVCF